MNETTKTFTFVGVAIVVMIVAIVARPKPPAGDPDSPEGDMLNAVSDPLVARRLEIVEYEEETAKIRPFEVAQINNRWSIPSHENYPADAEQQMGEAAVSVMNLKILHVQSTDAGDHALYGVIEPDIEKIQPGAKGVGTRVTMKDEKGEVLVNMVIGKPVKDQEGQRYVREVGKDPVYVVQLDPSKLSTKFEDWIEKDLLKLNPMDIRTVQLNDYSADLKLDLAAGIIPVQDVRSQIALEYDDEKSEWSVAELKEFDPETNTIVEVEPGEDEELDSAKLNDMKTALDDLKIVDVARKPEGLSRDLKAEQEFVTNREAAQSLQERGFIPVRMGQEGEIQILSKEGEAICGMNDGVEYVLRFGEMVLGSGAGGGAEKGEDGEEKKEEESGINRYLFVTARLNQDAIPEPEYAPLPELPGGDQPDTEKEPASEKDASGQPDKSDGEAESEEKEQPDVEEAEGAAAEDSPAEAEDAPENGDADQEDKSEDEKSEDKADDKAAATKKAIEEAREKIQKENDEKRAAYEKKVQEAKDRVTELNDRFGDWYYVISDEVYKKIHLGRKDIFKEKEKPADEEKPATEQNTDGADALDKLQEQGLKASGE